MMVVTGVVRGNHGKEYRDQVERGSRDFSIFIRVLVAFDSYPGGSKPSSPSLTEGGKKEAAQQRLEFPKKRREIFGIQINKMDIHSPGRTRSVYFSERRRLKG